MQLYHNMIRDRSMQDVSIETNLWDCQLKEVKRLIKKEGMPGDFREKCYKTGMDTIARGKGKHNFTL